MSGHTPQIQPALADQPFHKTEPIIQLGMLRLLVLGGGSADIFLN